MALPIEDYALVGDRGTAAQLRLMTHAETGGIVAAPTTSLPALLGVLVARLESGHHPRARGRRSAHQRRRVASGSHRSCVDEGAAPSVHGTSRLSLR